MSDSLDPNILIPKRSQSSSKEHRDPHRNNWHIWVGFRRGWTWSLVAPCLR